MDSLRLPQRRNSICWIIDNFEMDMVVQCLSYDIRDIVGLFGMYLLDDSCDSAGYAHSISIGV